MLLIFLFINIVFTPILVMIPWYVENVFKGNGSDLAWIEAAMGAGAFLTGMYLSLSAFTVKADKRIGMIATYFQTSLKEHEVPSIMVAVNVISAASMPLSFAISGILFPIVDIPRFALICGLLTMLTAFGLPIFLKTTREEGDV